MQITDFSKPLSSKTLNESLAKSFGCNIKLESFSDGQLQDARNKLRTKISQFEVTESFDSINSNHEYQKTRMFLDVINQEIFEREMSAAEKEKETEIKKKTDKSGMKASMQKQYGKEKGKEAYFATIRKRAMAESVPDSWIEQAISRITLGECDTDELKNELKIRFDLSESQASWMLCENEEAKAEIIMATKDMVDRVTGWLEDTAAMQAEQLLELLDSIKTEFGLDITEQYSTVVRQSLGNLYTCLEDSRALLSQGLDIVSGNTTETMGVTPDHSQEPLAKGGISEPAAAPSPSLASAEPEEGEPVPDVAGRMKRESVDYRAKLDRLLEGSKKKIIESTDPLVLSIQSVISAANSEHTAAQLSWAALNRMIASQGAPSVDASSFGIEYDSNPVLKSLVKSFDKTGIVLNTDVANAEVQSDTTPKTSKMSSSAKQAAKRALKK